MSGGRLHSVCRGGCGERSFTPWVSGGRLHRECRGDCGRMFTPWVWGKVVYTLGVGEVVYTVGVGVGVGAGRLHSGCREVVYTLGVGEGGRLHPGCGGNNPATAPATIFGDSRLSA